MKIYTIKNRIWCEFCNKNIVCIKRSFKCSGYQEGFILDFLEFDYANSTIPFKISQSYDSPAFCGEYEGKRHKLVSEVIEGYPTYFRAHR